MDHRCSDTVQQGAGKFRYGNQVYSGSNGNDRDEIHDTVFFNEEEIDAFHAEQHKQTAD